jgi:hypothetical protein
VLRARHLRQDSSCSSVASEKSLEGAMVTGSYSKKRLAVVENPQTFAPTQVSRTAQEQPTPSIAPHNLADGSEAY